MSRIGKVPVAIPEKVEVKIEKNTITIKGSLGELSFDFSSEVQVKQVEATIVISPKGEGVSAIWGTTRAIIQNMTVGVSEGFKKSLEISGVGYKFEVQGKKLILSIWYSHKVDVEVPEGMKVVIDENKKNIIHVSGIDKQKVWQFASKIKAKKKPEPYKGKGIKYSGEYIRRKAGKSAAK